MRRQITGQPISNRPVSVEAFRQDLAYTFRGLRAKPGFTIAVVVTLALGLGANAAMFGIVDQLLFRTPPQLRDPETAHNVYFVQTTRGREVATRGGLQYARYRDIGRWTSSFSAVAGYTRRDLAVGVGEDAREMSIGIATASFFSFFDAPAELGRYFTPDEDQPPAGALVAVLSHALWQTRYGGRADVLGSRLQIGPKVYTIIGVAPRRFVGVWEDRPPAAFIPLSAFAAATRFKPSDRQWWTTYGYTFMSILVRRRPDVSLARANADLTQAFLRSLDAQRVDDPKTPPNTVLRPRALAGSIIVQRGPNRSPVTRVATWLAGVSLLVLLIACANVANLLLARALRRRREIALRLALGVSRLRLASQLLTESIVLALSGGVAGMLVAQSGGAVLRATLLEESEAGAGFGDARTLLFAFGAATLVGVLTGMAPVLQARRVDLTADLRSGSREGTRSRSTTRLVLLVAQGALSVILLVGAGLFIRSLHNVRALHLGYEPEHVLFVDHNMRGTRIDSAETVALISRLGETAKAIPGVTHASLVLTIPFWSIWTTPLFVDGTDSVSSNIQFNLNAGSPELFATLGIRMLRGRAFTDADGANGPRVVVVSDGMAHVLWPGRDALGQCLRLGLATAPCTTVIGVAEDVRDQSLTPNGMYHYYLPATQFNPQSAGLAVRTDRDPAQMAETVRRQLQREMPGASYLTVTPLSQVVADQTRSWNLGATMFTAFGALALVLAAVGVYSVIAYDVQQRMHELGVRVALGAQWGDVVRLVVGGGLRVAAMGVAIGTGLALLAGRWVSDLLFDVSPHDPFVFTVVALTLVAVAAAATWLPALRASRVDPNVALRAE